VKGTCSFCSEQTTVIQGNGKAVCVPCAKKFKDHLSQDSDSTSFICPGCGVEPPALFVVFDMPGRKGLLYLVASGFDEKENYIYRLVSVTGTWEPNSMPTEVVCKICETKLPVQRVLKNPHVYKILT